jgi:hypothetical protein
MTQYIAWNTAAPTTAMRAAVTTGTSIKTMLQIATPATKDIKVVRWGVRFDTAPTAIIRCELVQADVAATVTAHVAAGVQPYDDPNGPASLMTLGTTATGYTSSGEGTVTATRTGDEWIAPIRVSYYYYEWSQGREWKVPVSKFLRVRVTTAVANNMLTYICWEE